MKTPRSRSLARLVVGGALAVFFSLTFLDRDESRTKVEPTLSVPPVTVATETRPNYRHSVVPGGVYSDAEAQSAARHDGIVKAHYSPVNLRKLTPVVLDRSIDRYVSFRRNDRIYWTSRRTRVPKGELLLSDGESLVRARCGNRLSETPQEPTVARGTQEPSDEELSTVDEWGNDEQRAEPGVVPVQRAGSAVTQSSGAGLPSPLAISPAAVSPSTVAGLRDETQAIYPAAGVGGGYGPAPSSDSVTSASTLTPALPPADIPQFGWSDLTPVANPTVTVVFVDALNIIPAQPGAPESPGATTPSGPSNPNSSQPTDASSTGPAGSQAPTDSRIPRGDAVIAVPSGSLTPSSGLRELPAPLQEIPEPGTFVVCAFALAAVAIRRRCQG